MNKVWEYYQKYPFWGYEPVKKDLYSHYYYNDFIPNNWILNKETPNIDFAKFINALLIEVDNRKKDYRDIKFLTREYEYYSTQRMGVIIPEEKKNYNALDDLFIDCYFEIDDLGKNEYCNTSRDFLDLAINSILFKDNFVRKYKNESKINWDLIISSFYLKNEIVSNYLQNCLYETHETENIEKIFEGLVYQDIIEVKNIDKFLFENLDKNGTIQSSVIDYIKFTNRKDYNDLLIKLKNSNRLNENNKSKLEVAICKSKFGEEGLFELYKNTDIYNTKHEIVESYKNFKTKSFFEFIFNFGVNETQKNEYGVALIMIESKQILRSEEYFKVFDWFDDKGLEYLNKINGYN